MINAFILVPYVELILAFETVRNFSWVKFHVNNQFEQGIQVFKKARLFFSVGGEYFGKKPVVFTYVTNSDLGRTSRWLF